MIELTILGKKKTLAALLEMIDKRRHIRRLEQGGTGDQNIYACRLGERCRIQIDAAIDGDQVFVAVLVAPFDSRSDLAEHVADEFLPAESRVDGHNQKQVDVRKEREIVFDRGVWIERNPGFGAFAADFLENLGVVFDDFAVDSEIVGTGIEVGIDILLGVGDHEVDIKGQIGDAIDLFDDERAETQVRHEVAIHDIAMQPVDAGGFDIAELIAQAREIGGEYRWCNNCHWGDNSVPDVERQARKLIRFRHSQFDLFAAHYLLVALGLLLEYSIWKVAVFLLAFDFVQHKAQIFESFTRPLQRQTQ